MWLTSSCDNSWSGCLSWVMRCSAMRFHSFIRSFSDNTHSTTRLRSLLMNFIGPCSDNRKRSKTSILHNADTYDFSAAFFFGWRLATSTKEIMGKKKRRNEKNTENLLILNPAMFSLNHLLWHSCRHFIKWYIISSLPDYYANEHVVDMTFTWQMHTYIACFSSEFVGHQES